MKAGSQHFSIDSELRELIENTPICIKVFDCDFRIVYVNAGGRLEHKLNVETDLAKWDWIATVNKKDSEEIRKKFKEAVEEGKSSQVEFEHETSGSLREWCLGLVNPVKDEKGEVKYVLLYSVDISKYKKTEEELNVNTAIFNNLTEGIYLIGLEDLLIKWANPVFEKMFGYKPCELIGKKVDIVNAPTKKSPADTRASIVEILEKTGEWHGEVHNIKKDGTTFWCWANVSLLDHPKYGKTMVSVHTDITKEKQISEKQQKSITEMTKLNQLMIGRELKMIELKKEIEGLKARLEVSKDKKGDGV